MVYCGMFRLDKDGVIWYFVDNEYYFKRDSLYGHYDDGERFGFFSRAVIRPWREPGEGFRPRRPGRPFCRRELLRTRQTGFS